MTTRKAPGSHWRRVAAIAVGVVVLLVLVVPLLWPVPPLENVLAPDRLADDDSRFVEIGDVMLHYKAWGFDTAEQGADAPVAFVLLHGFGASTFSWEPVASQLSRTLPVIAFDRPGFGLTERPLEWEGPDPYSPETQADLTVELMDRLGVGRAVLIGHSAGGTVAALIAARHPDRVEAVILEDPAIYAGGPPRILTPLFRTPQLMRVGPLLARTLGSASGDEFIRSAWYDPSAIPEATFDGYRVPLQAQDWDKALWLLTVAPRPGDVPGVVAAIEAPMLFITGSNDTIVPPEDTERASSLVEGSRLVTIARTGHIPHEERPAEFLDAVITFLDEEGLLARLLF